MKRAALLYNLNAGRNRHRREQDVKRGAEVLRSAGIEVATEATESPSAAKEQARQFIDAGFDTIVAIGGDGTIHDVAQGMIGSEAALGVIPLGTANSLGNDLRLARDPAKAAQQLLKATPRRITVGRIRYQLGTSSAEKYFVVAAGIGVDAAMFYALKFGVKKQLGMTAYVAESLRQWAIQKFHRFKVEWRDPESRENYSEIVSQLLVVRVADFGGVLNRLAPGADLLRSDFRLVLFKTRSRARYLRFVLGRLIGQDWKDREILLAYANQVCCSPYIPENASEAPVIYAEADGENLGRIPVSLDVVPEALNLLIPPGATCLMGSRQF